MAYFTQPVLTTKASEEIAVALANKQALVFTRFSLGEGKHTTDVAGRNNTAKHVMSITANQSLERTEEIRVMGRLDNRTISGTINITEIGVFAKVGNRPEFMFLYTSSDTPDVVPPGSEASVIRDYTFNTRIDPNGILEINYTIGEDVYAKYQEVIRVAEDLQDHIDNKNNPHEVTKTQVGLGNVTNDQQAKESDFNSHTQGSNPHNITKAKVGLANVDNVQQASKVNFDNHTQAQNPHNITKAKVGLGNVDNYKTATLEQALAGTANNLFVTPFLVANMMGNIEDSGTANNGLERWIRFKDGTQIIYGIPRNKTSPAANGIEYVAEFPRPFVVDPQCFALLRHQIRDSGPVTGEMKGEPHITHLVNQYENSRAFWYNYNKNRYRFSYTGTRAGDQFGHDIVNDYFVEYIAIGRWK